jgi:ATP-dependent Lhr-like helicase
VPPQGLPLAFLELVDNPLEELLARYARTHVPFAAAEVAARLGLGLGPVRAALESLRRQDRLLEGEFLPGGREPEWCDVEVLRRLKRASLAKLSAAVEAVEPRAYARFLPSWHRVDQPGETLDDLLVAIEQIQGVAIPFGDLERAVLPARVRGYHPSLLDQLCASGEISWRGFEPLGNDDGRVALYLAGHAAVLAPAVTPVEGELAGKLRELLAQRGASFFADIEAALGGFRNELLGVLWDMVWAGEIGNDTLAPLRARARAGSKSASRANARRRPSLHGHLAMRRAGPPGSEGRWSLLGQTGPAPSETERATATAVQMLERFGVVTREAVRGAGVSGGFSAYYPIYRELEQAGKIRRGYFIAGMGGAQFGLPGAEDRLREEGAKGAIVVLAACDPANAYGAALAWPRREQGPRPQRIAGAHVFLSDGWLLAWLSRSESSLLCFIDPELIPDPAIRERCSNDLAEALVALLHQGEARRKAMLLERIDDLFANEHPLAEALCARGFRKTHDGLLRQRDRSWERRDGGGTLIVGVGAAAEDE